MQRRCVEANRAAPSGMTGSHACLVVGVGECLAAAGDAAGGRGWRRAALPLLLYLYLYLYLYLAGVRAGGGAGAIAGAAAGAGLGLLLAASPRLSLRHPAGLRALFAGEF